MVLIDSQKLIRCYVTNLDGIPTARFIEVEVFKLWRYMMTNKHGLSISRMSLCLWVNEEEFKQKEKLYTRSGEVETVHRIVISIFDSKNGFSHMTCRYALDQDVNKVKSILMSHMPGKFINRESLEIEAFPGRVIDKGKILSMDDIILGLSND